MRPLFTLIAFGFAAHAYGQQAQPATAYKLKHVVAADASKAVAAWAATQKMDFVILPEPLTNTVFVAGDPADQKKVVELFAALDKEPAKLEVAIAIVEVPGDFAKEVGLGDGEQWVLTPREARMMTAALRALRRAGAAKFKSEPKGITVDNRPFCVRHGEADDGIEAGVTPRLSPDGGSIRLAVELKATMPDMGAAVAVEGFTPGKGTSSQATHLTESVPVGGTLVIRAGRGKTDKGTRDLLFVVTPTVDAAGK